VDVTVLLDGNVLVALAVVDHLHHGAARRWFSTVEARFATTPITQGTLLRLLIRNELDARQALSVLRGITRHRRHDFWPADSPYDTQALRGVVGHRQVTDGYLAALARRRKGRIATFDQGLAVAQPDVVELIET
jgi:toxin-antitoxin system PIN domain toxin